MMVREHVGMIAGRLISPALQVGTKLRKRRVFHPSGVAYSAEVTPLAVSELLRPLAEQLGGHAIVRFSGAWWKTPDRRPDLLGCAIRFCDPERELAPTEDDQDLVFATLRLPWTLPLALLSTRTTDWLSNHYYGASPFEIDGVGWVKLRLRPPDVHFDEGDDRLERLEAAAEQGDAVLRLELKRHLVPSAWVPLAEVALREKRELEDPNALRFNPFLNGRGLKPRGFVHALRRPSYLASQRVHHAEVHA